MSTRLVRNFIDQQKTRVLDVSRYARDCASENASLSAQNDVSTEEALTEVGAFYWTASAPVIVNPGREEQGLVSV
jgi:hypothetical protein